MSEVAAQNEIHSDPELREDVPTDAADTHDLIRSLIAADAGDPGEPENPTEALETESTPESDEQEDLDLIRSMFTEDDVQDIEDDQAELEPELAQESFETTPEEPHEQMHIAPDETVGSSFPSFLRRSIPASAQAVEPDTDVEEDIDDAGYPAEEPTEKLSWAARRRQKAEAKAAAKAAKQAEKQAIADAKAEAKAARAAAKQAKINAAAEAKAARAAAKQERLDAAAAAKAQKAEAKQAKINAAAEAKAARAAAKQAKLDAAAERKAERAAAKQAKADAAAAAVQAKANAKEHAKAARLAEKQTKAEAVADAKAARAAAKQAKADAKAEAKAARVAEKLAKTADVSPSVSDAQTEEIQKNVLEAVSLEATGETPKSETTPSTETTTATAETPAVGRTAKVTRKPGKSFNQRAAEARSAVAGAYMRLPERPSKKQALRATAVFVLLVEPWLVPLVGLIAFISLTFAYFAMGPDRAAEITGAAYDWLKKRYPDKAEQARSAAQVLSERMSGWVARLPDRWSRGVYFPDFSKDTGKTDAVIEDRFERLAREARGH